MSRAPEPLLLIAREIAKALGPLWQVKTILSTAILAHPCDIHVMLNGGSDHLLLTADVSVSRDQLRPLQEVTASVATAEDRATSVSRSVEAIHDEILPHFGRQDAIAGLGVLSLPLRDAGIDAIAEGDNALTTITYDEARLHAVSPRYEQGERRPLRVTISSTCDDNTRVEVLIPHLSIQEASRITQPLRPGLSTPLKGAQDLPAEVRSQVALHFPGLAARHVVSDVPRYTELVDPSDVLCVRHALAITREEATSRFVSWASVSLRDASVAQAYAVLRCYAS